MDNEKMPGSKGMIVEYKPEGDEAEVKDVEAEAETSEAGIPNKVILLKGKAKELDHLLDHQPPNPECEACISCKMRDVQHFTGAFQRVPSGVE